MSFSSPKTSIARFERWSSVCRTAHATRGVKETYEALLSAYQEPVRAYHNLEHIAHCLREFDIVSNVAENPLAVELAIWFHDVVYNTRARDNEERSAEQSVTALAAMGVTGELPRTVKSLVLLTKHDEVPTTVDGRIVVDVDLSILGQPEVEFDRYESAVRSEYSWMEDSEFWLKRRDFLEKILTRERIFQTAPFARRYELSARKNLKRSISRIASVKAP